MNNKLLLILGILMIIVVSGCATQPPEDNQTNNHTNNQSKNHTMIILKDGTLLEYNDCVARGVNDKVVVFHSVKCPACGIAVPRLEELDNETDHEFEFIELSTNVNRAYELGLMPELIPTVLIKCKAYVGVRTKEEYRNLIEE